MTLWLQFASRTDQEQQRILLKDENMSSSVIIATIDCGGYKPDEITINVEGNKIIIKGEHRAEGDFGLESSSFSRTYPLPEGVDPKSIQSKISSGGSMTIEASKVETKQVDKSADTTVITVRSGSSQSTGDVANIDEKRFNVILDVSGYSAADIKVKVFNNEISVVARRETKEEGRFHSHSFNRHFALPRDFDMNTITARLSKGGKLSIEAKRVETGVSEERLIPIVQE